MRLVKSESVSWKGTVKNMELKMTEISQANYDAAVSDILTIQDAVRYLEKEAKTRTLRSKLEKFSRGKDLRNILVQGLLENDTRRKKDSVERRVRGWLSDGEKIRSIKKQDAIEVSFILGLSIEEADQLVSMISEEALHYRSPDEIVYIFALKQGMPYKEAMGLGERMKGILSKVKESEEVSEENFTPMMRSEIDALQSEEELADYLEHAVGRLGRYHNYAYREFMDRLKMLEEPLSEDMWTVGGSIDKERLTIRDILREYLFERNVLYAKERAGKKKGKGREKEEDNQLTEEEKIVFTKIQENVSASWPDESMLSKMKCRKADVTRKVLILLFLATDEGMDWSEEEWDWADSSGDRTTLSFERAEKGETAGYIYEDMDMCLTRDDVFEDLYVRLNYMLSLCGFAPLDPRSPFDWLILYCICVEDMLEMDVRMRGIFKEMFGERKEVKKEVSVGGNQNQVHDYADDIL